MSVKIIVDSTADVTEAVRSRVDVVPLTIRFGEEEFTDGVTIDTRTFYERLEGSDVLPTTSQATPFAFEEAFGKAVEEGHQVVCITISSRISGTYQSAAIAAEEFPGQVWVVDSRNVALGSAVLAEYALILADRGMDAEAIAQELIRKREKVHLMALLDTLEYLKKGGRISATAAIAGGLLNIKPLICTDCGEIKVLGKARGTRQANSLMLQEMEKTGGVDFDMPVLLGYTGVSSEMMNKFLQDSASFWEAYPAAVPSVTVGSVVGTHAGPGAVAVGFFSR